MEDKIRKDDAAWKKQLTQNQYYVPEEGNGATLHRRVRRYRDARNLQVRLLRPTVVSF